MPKTVPLLHKRITLASALDDDDNVLHEMGYPEQRMKFFVYLLTHCREIEAIVSYHLGLKNTETCRIGEVRQWIAGSFNVCIPVYIDNWTEHPGKRILIRFPLPYKVGESQHPGNADEKLRCEAATFVWIQENCPSIPIPYLWGFGFSTGQSFTTPEKMPFYTRLMWYSHRIALSLFGYSLPCRYVSHRCPRILETGYLVMDYIEEAEGKMLSESWEELRQDQNRRSNLFKGLSRILLSLAQSPLPRIGSLTIDNQGFLSLTNRPLTLRLQHLENEGIPTNIDRNLTYSTTDAYLLDLLTYHDNRLRHQPNSIRHRFDGQAQLSILTVMRALLPQFTSRDLRHGPFVVTLTDLHQSNIFVDKDWHIKCLVDLEWACSRPLEMLHPPYWLTSRGVDQLEKGEHLETFTKMHSEFMDTFENEERLLKRTEGDVLYHTHVLRRGWKIGNFWYFYALDNPKGLHNIFLQHIQPRFAELDDSGMVEFERTIAPYWSADALEVITEKVKDKEAYENQLRDTFAAIVEEPGLNNEAV